MDSINEDDEFEMAASNTFGKQESFKNEDNEITTDQKPLDFN